MFNFVNMKTLKLSKNKILAGVCAGIAEYLDVNVNIIRLLCVAITLFYAFFGGVILYIVCAIVIPSDN